MPDGKWEGSQSPRWPTYLNKSQAWQPYSKPEAGLVFRKDGRESYLKTIFRETKNWKYQKEEKYKILKCLLRNCVKRKKNLVGFRTWVQFQHDFKISKFWKFIFFVFCEKVNENIKNFVNKSNFEYDEWSFLLFYFFRFEYSINYLFFDFGAVILFFFS